MLSVAPATPSTTPGNRTSEAASLIWQATSQLQEIAAFAMVRLFPFCGSQRVSASSAALRISTIQAIPDFSEQPYFA
jgi:hypothetical protein